MSRIHFVGGEKGGVGKSFFARTLCQYFIDREQPFAALDADPSHGSLQRSYQEFTRSVDLERVDSADAIMDRAIAAERRVVVDLPAQSLRLLERWLDSGQVFDLAKEMQVGLSFWHVTDGGHDSVRSLERLLDAHGRAFRCIVVRNHGRGRSFQLLDDSRLPTLLEQCGGLQLDFPELEPSTAHAIDRAGVSFWSAAQRGDGAGLSQMTRARTRRWLDDCYSRLDALRDAL
jgi:hypothetical protein